MAIIFSVFFIFPAIILTVFVFVIGVYMWHKSNIRDFENKIRSRKNARLSVNNDGPEVIIVGAGIVGSALATSLARDGRRVTIIERSMVPPKSFAGEVMMPGGVEALSELGLDGCMEGLDGYWYTGIWVQDVAKERAFSLAFTEGYLCFHHNNLVLSLRNTAEAENLVTIKEGTVLRLLEESGIVRGVEYRLKGEEDIKTLKAPLVVLTDGSYSRLRKVNVGEKPNAFGSMYAFQYEENESKRVNTDLFLSDDDFCYAYKISPRTTRIIFNVNGPLLKNPKEHFKSILSQYPVHAQCPLREAIEEGRVWRTPTYKMPPGTCFQPGVLTLGDAFNMRHPVTASGMSVGLKDTVLWRDLLHQIGDLTNYEALRAAMKIFLVRRKLAYSASVNVFANILNLILAPKTAACKDLRFGLLEYLDYGKFCNRGVADVFAITSTNPAVLYYHLIAITFYAMYICIKNEKRQAVMGVYRALRVFGCALSFLVPLTWVELRTMFLHRTK